MYLTIDAQDVVLDLVGPGTVVGEDTVPDGKVGLVFGANGDTVLVVGTPQQLRSHVLHGFSLPVPANVPLFDNQPNWNGVVPWPTAFTLGNDDEVV